MTIIIYSDITTKINSSQRNLMKLLILVFLYLSFPAFSEGVEKDTEVERYGCKARLLNACYFRVKECSDPHVFSKNAKEENKCFDEGFLPCVNEAFIRCNAKEEAKL